jgi:hypothetical protein
LALRAVWATVVNVGNVVQVEAMGDWYRYPDCGPHFQVDYTVLDFNSRSGSGINELQGELLDVYR